MLRSLLSLLMKIVVNILGISSLYLLTVIFSKELFPFLAKFYL